MNKKGSIFDIMMFIVTALVVVLFFGLWIYMHGILTTQLTSIGSITTPTGGVINITEAAEQTFGQINDQMGYLKVIAFIIIFASALSILVSNFLIKAHPLFFFVYVFVIMAAVVFSVEVSNTYEKMLSDATIGPTLDTFTGANFIMLNLPIWVTVVGFFGAIFLFVGIVRDQQAGGTIT